MKTKFKYALNENNTESFDRGMTYRNLSVQYEIPYQLKRIADCLETNTDKRG